MFISVFFILNLIFFELNFFFKFKVCQLGSIKSLNDPNELNSGVNSDKMFVIFILLLGKKQFYSNFKKEP